MGRLESELGEAVLVFGGWLLVLVACGLGNTVGYHRLLTHRSFQTVAPVRWGLVLLGAVYSGSPMQWIAVHRIHHMASDTDRDPHSPVAGPHGAWWAHAGWLIGSRRRLPVMLFALSGFGLQMFFIYRDVRRLSGSLKPDWRKLCSDFTEDRLLRWLDAPLVMPLLWLAQVGVAVWIGGWWGMLWLWTLHLVLTNSSWAVNSFGHMSGLGDRPHETRDASRNIRWLAVLTHGEGFHNHHHRYPRSAWHGLGDAPDFSWRVIRALVAVGLAREPWLPRTWRNGARGSSESD